MGECKLQGGLKGIAKLKNQLNLPMHEGDLPQFLMNVDVLMFNDLYYIPPKTPYFDTTMCFTRLTPPYIAYKYFEIKT